MLLSWYSAARTAGQGAEVLSRIQRLGQKQIAGTDEALKSPGERSLAFKNPEFVLGRADYLSALQSTQVAQPKRLQPQARSRELENAA